MLNIIFVFLPTIAIVLIAAWLQPKLHRLAPPLTDCTGIASMGNALGISAFFVIAIVAVIRLIWAA